NGDIIPFSEEVCSQYHEHVHQQSIPDSDFNCRCELFAPCHVLFSPESRIHTRIEPLDLEFLDFSLLSTGNTTARGDSMMEDDQDDLAEEADLGLQSYWDTGS
ncbi:hypothetical protein Tco_1521244, partial [Tanacetum coccineum]